MTAPIEVLLSASAALKVLSKTRCVESYSFGEDVKYKIIRPWPSKFEKNQESKEWLSENGIHANEVLRVKAFPVPYSDYKSRVVINTQGINKIRAERNVVVSAMVSMLSRKVERIICIWDMDKYPDRICPKSTDDEEKLKQFASLDNSMLGFLVAGNNFYYKIPAFAGKCLFQEADLFRNKPIESEDVSASSSKKTDHMSRTERYIVHKQHSGYLERVFGNTLEAMENVVNESWASKLRAASISHYAQKNS
ncbi:hypothetical protein ACGTNG_11805 [Halomonas sp. 1390]|uniref:hypothetical protein n=1 Tax=Halomonas sp. B23F22_3 TaxID=3459516 RepID=UPI00373EAA8C